MNDRELVEHFLADRGEESFRRLYRRHAPRIYPTLLRLLAGRSGEVEDVFQDCWTRIVEGLPGFGWRSSLRTWMTGIALNCARECLRRRRSEELEREPVDRGSPHPERVAGRLDLDQALGALAAGYREVLVLHDLQGHSHEEVGELLGIAAGTSKSQLSRARAALRRSMDPRGDLRHG